MPVLRTPASSRFSLRGMVSALALATLALGAAQYAPEAQARSFHHGGHFHGGGFRVGGAFIGGAIIGAAFARPYYYSSYYPYYPNYYPPAYYAPPAYSAPVSYVQQPDPYYSAPPAPSAYAPAAYSAPQQRLTVEQRAQRLKSMCAQGLFTPQECAQRRAQLLREM